MATCCSSGSHHEPPSTGGPPPTGSIVWADLETKTKPIGVRVTEANGRRKIVRVDPGTTADDARGARGRGSEGPWPRQQQPSCQRRAPRSAARRGATPGGVCRSATHGSEIRSRERGRTPDWERGRPCRRYTRPMVGPPYRAMTPPPARPRAWRPIVERCLAGFNAAVLVANVLYGATFLACHHVPVGGGRAMLAWFPTLAMIGFLSRERGTSWEF